MPHFKSYAAWIELQDGYVDLPEYGVVEDTLPDGTPRVSCWVPSSSGKEFSLWYAETEGNTSIIEISVDGMNIRGGSVPCKEYKDEVVCAGYRRGVETRDGLKPFQFGDCPFVEQEILGIISGTGEITMLFSDGYICSQEVCSPYYSVDYDFMPRACDVDEFDKQGIVHNVQLGQRCLRPPKETAVRVFAAVQKPRVCFRFRYRPFEVLCALGIIPRQAPSAHDEFAAATQRGEVIDLTLDTESEDSDHDPETDIEEEEIQRLKAQLMAMENRRAENKRKRSESMSSQGRNVMIKLESNVGPFE